MSKVNWREMIEDVVDMALEAYFQNPGSKVLLDELSKRGKSGASFTELENACEMNSSSLKRRLESFIDAGMIENFLERRENSKDYSWYRLTTVGAVAADQTNSMLTFLKDRMETILMSMSEVPEVRELVSPNVPPSHVRKLPRGMRVVGTLNVDPRDWASPLANIPSHVVISQRDIVFPDELLNIPNQDKILGWRYNS